MKVGLTYDLRDEYLAAGFSEEETAEFDRVSTIEAIEGALRANGYETDRIGNIWKLTERLAKGDRWDMVFNIAEGLRGIAREAQVPALLDAYNIPYTFSDPVVLGFALHKGLTKIIARSFGVPTPDFAVAEEEADLANAKLPFPLFAKPVAEGTGKGIDGRSIIRDASELRQRCLDIWERYKQPALIERFLPGREFTVGITGTGAKAQAVAALEVVLLDKAEKGVYSYVNKEQCEELVEYRLCNDALAKEAIKVALHSWRCLNCRDGGRVDLRCDEHGQPCFIEVNPLAGLHPEHSDLPILSIKAGVPYIELIKRIMDSAKERI